MNTELSPIMKLQIGSEITLFFNLKHLKKQNKTKQHCDDKNLNMMYHFFVGYICWITFGKVYSLMVIAVGNEHVDHCSNPGQGCLHFTQH